MRLLHDKSADRWQSYLLSRNREFARKNAEGNIVEEFYSVEEKRLISVATIQSALGFNFRITGLDLREAQDLALLLRAGALAAPMYIVEERTVAAQLGDENIRSGWHSQLAVSLCPAFYGFLL